MIEETDTMNQGVPLAPNQLRALTRSRRSREYHEELVVNNFGERAKPKEEHELDCTCGKGDAPLDQHKSNCHRRFTIYQRERRQAKREAATPVATKEAPVKLPRPIGLEINAVPCTCDHPNEPDPMKHSSRCRRRAVAYKRAIRSGAITPPRAGKSQKQTA